MLPFDLVVLLYLTRCASHAIPVQDRDLFAPLNPLKSVASELYSIVTAPGGATTATTDATTPSLGQVSPTSATQSSTDPESTGGIETITSTQDGGSVIVTITTAGTVPGASAFSGTTTQSLTGSEAGITSSTSFPGSDATGSQATVNSVVPTTTHASSSSSSGTPASATALASTSSSGDGGGSNPNPGSGGGSGSGSSSPTTKKSTRLSSGQLAAVVVLPVLALLAAFLLVLRFCPPARKRYQNWRQQRRETRAYRRALDDPIMSFNGPGIGGDVEQSMRPLSFGFQQPQVESVRRKPLNWDASSLGSGGAGAIGMAVPMGDSRREYEHRRAVSDISEESDITSRYEDARSEDS